MNNVSIIGRLTADPDTKQTASGFTFSRFSVAIDRPYSRSRKEEREGDGKQTADFPRVVVWGKQAEMAERYLKKGRLVGVEGAIVTGSYDKEDGSRVFTTEINANRIRFLDKMAKVEADTSVLNDEQVVPF